MLSPFSRDDSGQDMVEYTLLIAAVALAGGAAVVGIGPILDGLWVLINGRLANASN